MFGYIINQHCGTKTGNFKMWIPDSNIDSCLVNLQFVAGLGKIKGWLLAG